ncbi:hypothetical protein BX616_008305, partial [Lobosporangium transversale]
MKTSLKTFLFASLACLQYLSGTDAQAASPTTPVATVSFLPGPSQTPIHTPGLNIPGFYTGIPILQNSVKYIVVRLDKGPI